jgi:anionic cell wall polymer biosynthesis LytR-Cps2A-Psr (LCP) family protein
MKVSHLPRKVFVALSAILIAATSVPALAQAPQPPAPTAIPTPPKSRLISLPPNTFNIALLGVDKRPDKGFMNTDVIIIASVNPDVPAVTLLSIPRDTPAYIPGVGVQKINTAYAAGGPDLFKETILYNFGLKIDSYAMVNFAGVVHAVNALGGIDVIATCPIQHTFPRDPYYMGGLVTPRDYVDTFTGEVWPAGTKIPLTSIDIPSPGVYTLDGLHALAFARARKGIPGGDVDRGRREQRVLRALLAKARQVGSLNKLTDLYNAVKGDVESDMTLETILRYALMADKIGDAVIRSRYLVGYDANGAAMEDAPDRKLNRQAYLEQALNVALNQRINDGIPVEVINGTGDAGFALAAADRLKELGFVITDIRSADQPYKSSLIIDHTSTKKGSPIPLIQRTFNLKAANVQNDPQPEGPRFSIIIGPDFNTCYYAGSLKKSGSDPIATGTAEDVQTPLEESVVVTDSAKIEATYSQAVTETNVIISATALLTTTPAVAVAGAAPDAPLVPTAAITPTFFVPAGDLINVRSSPTVRARLMGRLPGPYESEIMGRSIDGKWLQFWFPRLKRAGWINSDVVTIRGYFENEPAVVDAPAMPEGQPQVTIPRGDVVNIRNGPGTNFNVLGRMRSRQTAFITGKNPDGSWWQIRYGNKPAWVNSGVVRAVGDLAGVPVVQ